MASEIDYKFKKLVKQLSKHRGSGTELISVYIPVGYPIHETTNKLRGELSQASNIKSKSTRTNVTGALERIINHLKLYRKTPENGMVVFCGNISDNPSKIDIELFYFEPPFPIKMNIYRCDSRFFLEPLEQMMEAKDSYGVVVLDGRDAILAIVKGTSIDVVKKLHSTAHAKIRKGGQSAARYQRLIEESIEKYYKRVGEAIDAHFLGKGLKGIIIGGPGPTKEFFYKAKPFNYQIKILGVVDTGYTDEYGIREVLAKSEDILAEQEAVKEKIIVERFIKEVVKDGLATYGIKPVEDAITSGQASEILVSEGLEYKRVGYQCEGCSEEKVFYIRENESLEEKCSSCGLGVKLEEEPLIDYFVEFAQEKGMKVHIISTNTVEGNQFLQGFGGIGAFLRYK
ncbi:peptide chain release factor 1 [Candidatus Micrarchaeota archaeon]|nr:peptide chain release factor 1 [Candidatus Micrarchaeota archaeon]